MKKTEKTLDNPENLPPAFEGEISKEPPVLAPENAGENEVTNSIQDEIILPEVKPENPISENLENSTPENKEIFYSPNGKQIFDPRLHVSKSSVTKSGDFRKKKGSENFSANEPQESAQLQNVSSSPELVGIALSGMTLGCLTVLFGGEMMPENKGEKQMLEGAFINFAKANQMQDIPPTLALCLTLFFYTAGKITQKEECKTRWQKFFDGAKKMAFNLYLKFKRK